VTQLFVVNETRELKTAGDHMMPPQQYLHSGLVGGRVRVRTWMASPARRACWPTAIMVVYGQRKQTSGQKTGRTNRKHNAPIAGYAACSGNIKNSRLMLVTLLISLMSWQGRKTNLLFVVNIEPYYIYTVILTTNLRFWVSLSQITPTATKFSRVNSEKYE